MRQFILIFILMLMLMLVNSYSFAQKIIDLNSVTITAERKVDTVFGTWKFSVADYEFYEDKLVLLTFTRNLNKAKVMLCDASQKILSSFDLPEEANYLYRDYMGYINVICAYNVYRVKINNNTIALASLPKDQFNARIMPCIDTIAQDIYFSNYNRDYPEFTYYAYNTADSSLHPFKTVADQVLLHDYNMEYYFLKSKEKLEVRKLAAQYHVDFHQIAAYMTGLTSSMFYSPLYAPMFVVNDSVMVFDHYNNAILTYNRRQERVDSVAIDYHHPKNWREWKNKVLMDSDNHKVYALYQKGPFYYLKQIDVKTGKLVGSFKLTNQYVDKIKIKNDYVYYVYRPFESLQEQFVYKELIRND